MNLLNDVLQRHLWSFAQSQQRNCAVLEVYNYVMFGVEVEVLDGSATSRVVHTSSTCQRKGGTS
jgi:hypothetical protein